MITKRQVKEIKNRLMNRMNEVKLMTPDQLREENKLIWPSVDVTGTDTELSMFLMADAIDTIIPDSLWF